MLLSKLRNPKWKNDTINVNTRSYKTDEQGCCSVHPADVAVLRDACGFEVVGQVETNSKRETEIRMPKSKEEFLDMAFAIGLEAEDLRNMANLLDPPAPKEEIPEPEPVTTYVAPPPPNQEKMITVPPDEEQAPTPEKPVEIEVAPESPPEEPSKDNGNSDDDDEVTISMGLSKRQLLELGTAMGLPVKQAMKKREIYDVILQSQKVDHHDQQNVQQPNPVGPT